MVYLAASEAVVSRFEPEGPHCDDDTDKALAREDVLRVHNRSIAGKLTEREVQAGVGSAW